MSNQPVAGALHPTDSHGGLRLVALAAVAAGVILLAAAAFVLSYSGIHAVALSAGVSPRLARLYPLIFDAMLVVACAAVLALRTAGLPSRCYAWLSLLALLAAAAAADALNATGTKLPHRPTAAVIAVIPWVLVLVGFGLLLAMLRHARKRRTTAADEQPQRGVEPAGHVQMRTGIDDLLGPRPSPAGTGQTAAAAPAAEHPAGGRLASGSVTPPDLPADLAIDLEPGHDDPVSDEPAEPLPAAPLPAARVARIPRARPEATGNHAVDPSSAPPLSPAPTPLAPVDYSSPGPARETGGREVGNVSATAEPEPVRVADGAPGPDPEPAADAPPEPDPSPRADAAPPLDEAALGGEAADGESRAEASDEAGTGPETEPPVRTGPAEPPLLQFDRMRSSPIPPGT